jgi:hypothetical protein
MNQRRGDESARVSAFRTQRKNPGAAYNTTMATCSCGASNVPCVPEKEQDGIVADRSEGVIAVQMSYNIGVPKLMDLTALRGNLVFVIGDDTKVDAFTQTLEAFQKEPEIVNMLGTHSSPFFRADKKEVRIDVIARRTILDVPQEIRSKGIVICFDEPSYNARQSLFHLFGEDAVSQDECGKVRVKPYQAFNHLMDTIPADGKTAIVFVPKALQKGGLSPVMWCPLDIKPPVAPPDDTLATALAAIAASAPEAPHPLALAPEIPEVTPAPIPVSSTTLETHISSLTQAVLALTAVLREKMT